MIRIFENYVGDSYSDVKDISNPIFHFNLLNLLVNYYLNNDFKDIDKLKKNVDILKNKMSYKYRISANFNSVVKNVLDEKVELIEKQLFLNKNIQETEYLMEDIYDILIHGYDYRNDPYGYIYKIGVVAPPIGLPFEKYSNEFKFYDKIHELKSMYLILKILLNIKFKDFNGYHDVFEKIL